MKEKLLTLETSHAEMSWLNAGLPKNILLILTAELVFQLDISGLKGIENAGELEKALLKNCTALTFQFEISAIKLFALLKALFMSVTALTSHKSIAELKL